MNELQGSELILPEIEELIVNGQPQFGAFKQVNHVNYLSYHSYLLSQKPLSNWRKKFKVNQFAFIQIIEEPFRICIAIATIKLATSAFVYIYNEKSHKIEIIEGINPLTLNSLISGDHKHGHMTFKSKRIDIDMQFTPSEVTIELSSHLFLLEANLSRGENPLAICAPSGRRGWTFTQKEPFTEVNGKLLFKPNSKHYSHQDNSSKQKISFSSSTLANLDWTLGYMRHETNWFWACINTKLPSNQHFMLNLSMGVNETGVSENACWIDGKIFYLPPVLFTRDNINPKSTNNNKNNFKEHVKNNSISNSNKTWYISNQQLGWSKVIIDLEFTPITVYKKTDNYGVVASIFEQWIGFYSGKITLPTGGSGKVIELNKVIGLAEDHFAKW